MKAFLLRGLHPHHQLDVHQQVKWLKEARTLLWRQPISLLNYLLNSFFDTIVLAGLDRLPTTYLPPGDRRDRTRARVGPGAAHVKQQFRDKLIENRRYVGEHGRDMGEIEGWSWSYRTAPQAGD